MTAPPVGRTLVEVFVPGRPVTKGSLAVDRNGNAHDTPASKAWRRLMAGAIRDDVARRAARGAWWQLDPTPWSGPVAVTSHWFLPRNPQSYQAGDIDKLMRNLLDALSSPGKRTVDPSLCGRAIVDDNQVQGLPETWQHADPKTPGVLIMARTLEWWEIELHRTAAKSYRDQLLGLAA